MKRLVLSAAALAAGTACFPVAPDIDYTGKPCDTQTNPCPTGWSCTDGFCALGDGGTGGSTGIAVSSSAASGESTGTPSAAASSASATGSSGGSNGPSTTSAATTAASSAAGSSTSSTAGSSTGAAGSATGTSGSATANSSGGGSSSATASASATGSTSGAVSNYHFVQLAQQLSSNDTFVFSFSGAPFQKATTEGDLIVVALSYGTDGPASATLPTLTASDTDGNTYHFIGTAFTNADAQGLATFYSLPIKGGDAGLVVTVDYSGGDGAGFNSLSIYAAEYNGVSSFIDGLVVLDGGLEANSMSVTAAGPAPGDLVWGFAAELDGADTNGFSAGTGFTGRPASGVWSVGGSYTGYPEDGRGTDAGAQIATWNLNDNFGDLSAAIAIFR